MTATIRLSVRDDLDVAEFQAAANLRISEIVDAPNWLVSLHFPLDIFR